MKSLYKWLAAVLAVLFLVGFAWVYLLKWSVNKRMYSIIALDFSRCKKSIPIISKGDDDDIAARGVAA